MAESKRSKVDVAVVNDELEETLKAKHTTGDNAPIMPKEYDALDELQFVTDVAKALMNIPGTLCYFNPSGEVLRDRESLDELLEFCEASRLIPLPAWCNILFFNLGGGWFVADGRAFVRVKNRQNVEQAGGLCVDVPDLDELAVAGIEPVEHFGGRVRPYLTPFQRAGPPGTCFMAQTRFKLV